MSNNRRRLCQTFLNYTQNHEKISSVIARIYRPDVCLFKRRSRSAGWIAYPRQPGRARSRNDPRRISPHLPTQVFRFRPQRRTLPLRSIVSGTNRLPRKYKCRRRGLYVRCDRHRSLHEPSLPESVGKRPDQTRCKQQQTARYARLFNQYSSEKFTCRKTRISCNCIVMPVLLKLRDGTYLRIRN